MHTDKMKSIETQVSNCKHPRHLKSFLNYENVIYASCIVVRHLFNIDILNFSEEKDKNDNFLM